MSLAGGATGVAVTLLLAGMIVRNNALGAAGAAEAGLWGVAVALVWIVGPLLRFLRSEVVVGDRDVEVTAGVLGSRRRASLGEITGVVEHAGALGRRLGYGTVVIHGRNATGTTLRHVRDAAALCRVLTARAKAASG